MANPVECILRSSDLETQFQFGGFQLWSSAQQVEVYCGDRSENYLTTVKGLKQTGNDVPWLHKAMCVVPGGPRPVTFVKLKLGSSSSATSATTPNEVRLHKIRWTLRVPEPQEAQPNHGPVMSELPLLACSHLESQQPEWKELVAANAKQTQSETTARASTFEETTDTVGAMMSGMTFALRQSEKSIVAQIQNDNATLTMQLGHALQQIQLMGIQLQSLARDNREQYARLSQENATLQQNQEQILMELRALGARGGYNGITKCDTSCEMIDDKESTANTIVDGSEFGTRKATGEQSRDSADDFAFNHETASECDKPLI